MKKYRVSRWYEDQIEAINCVSETATRLCIVENGRAWRTVQKESKVARYFDTWDDAQRWLIGRQEEIVEIARAGLEEAERLLDKYRSISEHEEE